MGRGRRQDSTCSRPGFQEVPRAGPHDTDPGASPCVCGSLGPSTPGSAPRWPRPSSSAGCPRRWSGRAGRCARGPARGRGTPRRTRAAGTAIGTVRMPHGAPAARLPALGLGAGDAAARRTDNSCPPGAPCRLAGQLAEWISDM